MPTDDDSQAQPRGKRPSGFFFALRGVLFLAGAVTTVAFMKVLSTNTGKPKPYEFAGVTITTSMRRTSVDEGIKVLFDRVDGDEFAVPKAHGVKEAVVYAVSASTFPELGRRLGKTVGIGDIGENLTIDVLDEADFTIGDEYEVGTARLRVSGPRYPCNRLNFSFQQADAMDVIREFRRPGVYFEVLEEGVVRRGDTLKLSRSCGGRMSVLELYNHMVERRDWNSAAEPRRPIWDTIASDPSIAEHFRRRFR